MHISTNFCTLFPKKSDDEFMYKKIVDKKVETYYPNEVDQEKAKKFIFSCLERKDCLDVKNSLMGIKVQDFKMFADYFNNISNDPDLIEKIELSNNLIGKFKQISAGSSLISKIPKDDDFEINCKLIMEDLKKEDSMYGFSLKIQIEELFTNIDNEYEQLKILMIDNAKGFLYYSFDLAYRNECNRIYKSKQAEINGYKDEIKSIQAKKNSGLRLRNYVPYKNL